MAADWRIIQATDPKRECGAVPLSSQPYSYRDPPAGRAQSQSPEQALPLPSAVFQEIGYAAPRAKTVPGSGVAVHLSRHVISGGCHLLDAGIGEVDHGRFRSTPRWGIEVVSLQLCLADVTADVRCV